MHQRRDRDPAALAHFKRRLFELNPGSVVLVPDPNPHNGGFQRRALVVGHGRKPGRLRVRYEWTGPAHHPNDGWGRQVRTVAFDRVVAIMEEVAG